MEADDKKTVFNMGLALLERINGLLNIASASAIEGNYDLWHRISLAIYREISPFLIDKERTEIINLGKKINLENLKKEYISGKEREEIISGLHSLDIYIKECLKKHDMYMPSKDDPSFAMIRM